MSLEVDDVRIRCCEMSLVSLEFVDVRPVCLEALEAGAIFACLSEGVTVELRYEIRESCV